MRGGPFDTEPELFFFSDGAERLFPPLVEPEILNFHGQNILQISYFQDQNIFPKIAKGDDNERIYLFSDTIKL